MNKYQVFATKTFQKDFKNLRNKKLKARIKLELKKLETNPHVGKKLGNLDVGRWRIRISDYRIRYDIFGKKVVLHRLRHRREIYR